MSRATWQQRRLFVALVAVVPLWLGACSGEQAAPESPSAATGVSPLQTVTPASPSPEAPAGRPVVSSTPPAASEDGGGSSPSPASTPDPVSSPSEQSSPPARRTVDHENGGVHLVIDVEPFCSAVGQPVAVVIRTEPDAHLTLVARFSDGDPRGQMGFAAADGNGDHTWRWVIPPDAPPGYGEVFITSSATDGSRRSTSKTEPFEVQGPDGCRGEGS